jgi:hypothetical protein
MIRILCVCWLSLSIVGIAMIFPYEEEKSREEEKMIENSDDN